MKIVDFIQKKCVLPARSGDLFGQHYELLPWQKKCFSTMFNNDGSVNVPNIYLIGARKTAKTDFAMLALAYRFFHPKRRGEVYTVGAFCERQGGILLQYFVELCSLVKEFKTVSKPYQDRVVHKKNGNSLLLLTKSRRSAYGHYSHVNVHDEVGIYDSECFSRMEILKKGSGLCREPQEIFLSNVPEHAEHRSLDLLREAEKSKEWQVQKFVANKKYKWSNPKAWASANPFYSYKKTPQVKKFYKQQYLDAKNSGSLKSQAEFSRLLLGKGTTLDSSRWIQPEDLQWATEKQEEKILSDKRILWNVGWDLSLQGSDSTSFCLTGMDPQGEGDPLKDENQKVYLYPFIFYGSIKNKKPSLREKILLWNRQGHLVFQGGQTIRQGEVLDVAYSLLEKMWFKDEVEFVFDPALSQSWIQACQDDYRCKTITYSPRYMTRACRVMQRKSQQKNIVMLGGRNPAVEWQCSNGVLSEMSRNWCLLSRLNKNTQLNIDCWSASLLGLADLLEKQQQPKLEVMVL